MFKKKECNIRLCPDSLKQINLRSQASGMPSAFIRFMFKIADSLLIKGKLGLLKKKKKGD